MGRRRAKFSDEELLEIYAKPLQVWNNPTPSAIAKGITKPGPLLWQKPAFMWEYDYASRLAHERSMHVHMQDNLLAFGGRGGGKCFGIDTPILMYDGSIKPVQDIQVGDLLMGPDSKPRKVTSLARGREEMFLIEPRMVKSGSFVCNKSHTLSLRVSDLYGYEKDSIRNITVEEFINLSKHDRDRHYLYKSKTIQFQDCIPLPIDPYFIGLWIGDGIHHSPCITNKDSEVIDYLRDLASSLGLKLTTFPDGIHHYLANDTKNSNIKNPVIESLKAIGVFKNKHLPDIVLRSSESDRLQILAGLMDSDGHNNEGSGGGFKGSFVFVQKNKQIAEGTAFLARSLGFGVSVRENTTKRDGREFHSYRLTIFGDVQRIPTKIKRKQVESYKRTKNALCSRFNVSSLGEGDYYGFEVEGPDRLFLLGDFTVVHNSALGVALNIFFLFNFPGCETLFGAKTYGDAEEILIKYYKRIFTIREPWDSPFVEHVPNSQDKDLVLEIPYVGTDSFGRETVMYKHSVSHGFHFSDWERLRGKEYSYAHMEELSQLKEEITLDEISRSLRSSASPIRMLYAATNPPQSRSHFMYDKWHELVEHMPNHVGDRPTPITCKCHFCDVCINDKDEPEEWLYDDEGVCTNPNCKFLILCVALGNKPQRYKKPSYTLHVGHSSIRNKQIHCPGDQPFWRVIHTATSDNHHLPSDFVQGIKASQDEANFAMFTQGQIIDLGSVKAFPSFSFDSNTINNELGTDPTKDIHWTHDHNVRPRCSVVIQEYPTEDEDVDIRVIESPTLFDTEEAVLKPEGLELASINPALAKDPKFIEKYRIRGVGPEHMAQYFINKYQDWNLASIKAGEQKTVYIHGDHTGWNSKMSPFSKNEFQIYADMLSDAGFKVIVACKKEVGKAIQIGVSDRIVLTNWMLRDDKGRVRIKINKSAKYLLKSLEDTERKTNGKEDVDKSCDELARTSTNTKKIHLVTHPAEALGYYLCRRFNMVKVPEGFKFIYVAGDSTLHFDPNTGKTREEKEVKPEPPKENQALALIDLLKADMPGSDDYSAIQRFRDYFY